MAILQRYFTHEALLILYQTYYLKMFDSYSVDMRDTIQSKDEMVSALILLIFQSDSAFFTFHITALPVSHRRLTRCLNIDPGSS